MKTLKVLAVLLALLTSTSAFAGWNIQSNKKYHITCDQYDGFMALGAYQGSSYQIYYQTNTTTPTDDGYWYILENGDGYVIQNAVSGQFLSWSSDYSTDKYMGLVDEVTDDNQRWVFTQDDTYIVVQNLGQSSYYWNLRTDGTYRVGTYAKGYESSNSHFHILDADGNEISTTDTEDTSLWSSSKRYLFHNANGYGYMIYDSSVSDEYPSLGGYTSGTNGCAVDAYQNEVDTSSPNNQWVISHDDSGYYYIYNIGKGQYIANAGDVTKFVFTDTAYPFEATEYSDGIYAFRLTKWADDDNAYMCAASQQDAYPIAYWTIDDAGSQWTLEEATSFSKGSGTSGGSSETVGYDTTVSWDGSDSPHTFDAWTSNNKGVSSSTSNYTVNATVSGQYLITFNWSVSSEATYDKFSATFDGSSIISNQSGSASGTFSQTYTLSAGTHVLKFTYSKDNYADSGNDCATVTNLTFTKIVPVTGMTVTSSSQKLKIGETAQLTVSVQPDDAADKTYTLTSSDPLVATVSSSGLVTALDAGTTTITATAKDGSGVTASVTITVVDAYVAHSDEMVYVRHSDGTATIIPKDYIAEYTYKGSLFTSTLIDGGDLTMKSIIDVTETAPEDLPGFKVYKFNNKFNDQLFTDAECADPTGDAISLEVGCIGKWLTASFQMTTDGTKAFVNGVRQHSKKTRQSFASPVIYQLTNDNWQTLRLALNEDGTYTRSYTAFTRKVTVTVDFLADHSTTEYKVPRIDITLGDGSSWSRNNWIGMNGKSTYESATIKIDGGGVYPDMYPTPIQIKGRGNTSWSDSYSSKNPYHFKFEEKYKPLGMAKGKHWVLLANKQAGSMTTNVIGQKIATMIGSAGGCHVVPVELYVNGSYRGNYNFMERIGFSNNSIDLEDETNAAMIELDTYDDETKYSSNDYSLPAKIHAPDMDDATTTLTSDQIIDDFNDMVDVVKAGDGSYTHQVDVDYLASYLMANEFIANCELKHPKSVFLYSENVTDDLNADGDDETPWVFGPVWDCDWAFGYEQNYSYYQVSATDNYFDKLLQEGQPQYFWKALRNGSTEVDQAYYTLWYKFINQGGLDELIDYCDEFYNYAGASLSHNSLNETSNTDGQDYATITTNCKTWLKNRANSIFSSLTTYPITADDDSDDDDDTTTVDKMGDVNDDEAISVADVVCVLNSMTNLPNETYLASRADMNSNGEVSIGDVVMLCNKVMEQPTNVKRQLHLPASSASMRLANMTCETNSEVLFPLSITVDEGAYSALQMDVQLPEGVELDGLKLPAELSGMTVRTRLMDNGAYRVVVYNDGSLSLPESTTTLYLRLLTSQATEGQLSVGSITLSTSQGEEERMRSHTCRIAVKDATTGIDEAAQTATSEQKVIYDLQGRRVQHVQQKGIYIINNQKKVVR